MDLLDWTERNLAAGKRGAIPDHLEPILQRVGIVSSGWCDLIQQFGRLFKRAVGSPQLAIDIVMKDFTKTGDASKLVSCFESTNQSVGGHPHAN